MNGTAVTEYETGELSAIVGSVFQNPRSQFFNMDTTGEVVFGCENLGLPVEEIHQRVKNTAYELGIEKLMDKDIFKLSGGEKQRLSIAAALVKDCPVMFLDEPTSGLDYENMKCIADILKELAEKGRTIFVITHDYELLLAACTRIIKIENMKITRDIKLTREILPELQAFFNILL